MRAEQELRLARRLLPERWRIVLDLAQHLDATDEVLRQEIAGGHRLRKQVQELEAELNSLKTWCRVHHNAHKHPEEAVQGSRPTPRAKTRRTASESRRIGLYCAWCGSKLSGGGQRLFCSRKCANTFNQRLKGTKAVPINRPQDAVEPPAFSMRIVAGEKVEALTSNGRS